MKLLNFQKDSDSLATRIVERSVSVNNIYNITKFSPDQESEYYRLVTSKNVRRFTVY